MSAGREFGEFSTEAMFEEKRKAVNRPTDQQEQDAQRSVYGDWAVDTGVDILGGAENFIHGNEAGKQRSLQHGHLGSDQCRQDVTNDKRELDVAERLVARQPADTRHNEIFLGKLAEGVADDVRHS